MKELQQVKKNINSLLFWNIFFENSLETKKILILTEFEFIYEMVEFI